MAATRTWDIFCSVIDNYGDIGVSWRLARQLASGPARNIRLWVDDLGSFHRLCRAVDPRCSSQRVNAVDVRHWREPLPQVAPADIVIEGFGVHLPETYVAAMAARKPHPVWINLEHLSAESWIDSHHALPSPHPRLPLTKYFFFPGFTSATGGLLMESGMAQVRDSFRNDPTAVAAFRNSIGLAPLNTDALIVSLFCYDNAALHALVNAWSAAIAPVACIVPAGAALAQLSRIASRPIAIGANIRLGNLEIHAIPFLELDQYDRLLWSCDLNFVRGEDSFVRAQLAARQLMWQAYPQEGGAHLRKASAFLERYAGELGVEAAAAYGAFMDAWNRESTDIGRHWAALRLHGATLAVHAEKWAGQLALGGNLVNKLAKFCEDRLE